MQIDLFDYLKAVTLRDIGLSDTEDANREWFRLALCHIDGIRKNRELDGEFTGENMREWIIKTIGHPKSPNVYGALTREAVRRGLIIDTGRCRKMTSIKSHARRTPIYIWA